MTWILILYIYAGAWSKGDSVALTNVPGFKSEAQCEQAGEQAMSLVNNSYKAAKYVCVEQ
jgi:hypothetical protein